MKRKMRYYTRKQRLFRLQLPWFSSNRKIKDRLFCYIFEQDRKALLQLYNALNNTDYQDEQALQIVTLDNVVYMSMNNDVAFLLIGTLNLYEHQSTICPNMPLRFLLYLAAEYEVLVSKMGANIYGHELVKLPAPECVVLYNGDEEIAEEQYLRLTDAFSDEEGRKHHSCLELTVRVLNINYGHNRQLMERCGRLGEYAHFVAKIKEFQKAGQYTDEAVDNAMVYCMEHGIMEDILTPFWAEVKKMLLTEYNERKYMRMFRKAAREEGLQEGRQEGLEQGRQEGLEQGHREGLEQGHREGLEQGIREGQCLLIKAMLQNGVSVEKISEQTGLSRKEVIKAGKDVSKRSSRHKK